MNEIWKNIKGYENYYQISNLGNIRSLERNYHCNYRWVYATDDMKVGDVIAV